MIKRWLILGCVTFCLAACSWIPSKPPSLYQRLGGQAALVAVVDDFVGRVAADERINDFFEGVDIPQLKTRLVEQICAGTGGSCVYTGGDMQTVHDEFSIESRHFNAMVEDLVASLNHFNVPPTEQNELLAILSAMKCDIVNTVTTNKPVLEMLIPPARAATIEPTVVLKKTTKQSNQKTTKPLSGNKTRVSKPVIKRKAVKQTVRKQAVVKQAVIKQPEPSQADINKLVVNPVVLKAAVAKDSVTQAPKPIEAVENAAPFVLNGGIQGSIILLGKDKNPVSAEKIIVSVIPLDPTLIPPRAAKTFAVKMQNKVYTPSHLVVQRGDTVTFKNLDRLKHNVFSSSPANRFDLGTYARGKRPGFEFKNEGLVKVYCNLHKRMFTYIQVMGADRSAITQADGFFSIGHLPPGRYTLKAWHVSAEISKPFVVTPGNTVSIDMTLDGSLFIPRTRAKKLGAYPSQPVKHFDPTKYPFKKSSKRDYDEEF